MRGLGTPVDMSHKTLAPPITTGVRAKDEELAAATVAGHVNWLAAMSLKSTAPGKAVTKLTEEGGEDLDLPPCLAATRDPEGTFTLGAAEGGRAELLGDAGGLDKVSATILSTPAK
jgi:hypothetical protein